MKFYQLLSLVGGFTLVQASLRAQLSLETLCNDEDLSLYIMNGPFTPDIILECFRNGCDKALSLLKLNSTDSWKADDFAAVLVAAVQMKKIRSFEFIMDNKLALKDEWFTEELQDAILHSDLGVLFVDLIPYRLLSTSVRCKFFIEAIKCVNLEIVGTASYNKLFHFRHLKRSLLHELCFMLGLLGDYERFESIMSTSKIDLRHTEAHHLVGAVRGRQPEFLRQALPTQTIIPLNTGIDLVLETIRCDSLQIYRTIKLAGVFRAFPPKDLYGLLLAIFNCNIEVFDEILRDFYGGRTLEKGVKALYMAQAELHGDTGLPEVLRDIDLKDDSYNLHMALAARLGHYEKLVSLCQLELDPSLDAASHRPSKLMHRFFKMFRYNKQYSETLNPIKISLFYDTRYISPSYQCYHAPVNAALNNCIPALDSFYDHGFVVPTRMEEAVLLRLIELRHFEAFEFFLERFSCIERVCSKEDFIIELLQCPDERFIHAMLDAWMPVSQELVLLAIKYGLTEGLRVTISGATRSTKSLVIKELGRMVESGSGDRGCLEVLLHAYPDSMHEHLEMLFLQLIHFGNVSFCRVFIESKRLQVRVGHMHEAAKAGDIKVFELLHKSVESLQNRGFSRAMYLAASFGHLEIVQALLCHSNLSDKYLRKAFIAACKLNDPHILKALMTIRYSLNPALLKAMVRTSIASNAFRVFFELYPMLVDQGEADAVLMAAFNAASPAFAQFVLGQAEIQEKPEIWWKVVAERAGQSLTLSRLNFLLRFNPSLCPANVLTGAISKRRVLVCDAYHRWFHPSGHNQMDIEAFHLMGRLLRAVRLFDLSLIAEVMQEAKRLDRSLARKLQKQLPELFANEQSLIEFAGAGGNVQASRAEWYRLIKSNRF